MVCIAVEFNSNIRYFEMRPKQTWYSAGIKFNSNIRYFEIIPEINIVLISECLIVI